MSLMHRVSASSQIVGTQAVMNIIMGERYKTFTKESRAVLKGEYGALVWAYTCLTKKRRRKNPPAFVR